MAGRVVPNFVANFPNSHLQHALAISVGSFKTDSTNIWAKRYNYPQTGITLFYSNIGNNAVFGNQFSAMAFVGFNVFNQQKKPIYLKLSLGATYFTAHFDATENRKNVNIGSPLNWGFLAGAYKTISEKEGLNLKLGLVFSHASNGHTQLPNFGLNSALISISAQFYDKKLTAYQLKNYRNKALPKVKNWHIGTNYGLGFHEYGDTEGPVGGNKKLVHSTSFFASKTINHHFKWGFGGTYRYYASYHDQITTRNLEKYMNNPTQNASNVVIYGNFELLLGHVGINTELGFNVYKPFYEQFEEDFPVGSQFEGYGKFKASIKRRISTKLGLNLYLFNTSKLPKHNFFIAPNIKANSGQADFTEIAVGYGYKLN